MIRSTTILGSTGSIGRQSVEVCKRLGIRVSALTTNKNIGLLIEQTKLLRPGYVTKEQMEAVLGEEVLVSPAILEKLRDGEVARSPGMKYKHYAPKAQVTILRGDFAKYKEFIKQHTEPGVWALCFDGEGAQLGVPFIEYGKNHDGVTQAHHLFTALRDLDKHGAQVVYARCPEQDGVSMAVYNRLIRAAAFRVVEL